MTGAQLPEEAAVFLSDIRSWTASYHKLNRRPSPSKVAALWSWPLDSASG